MSGLSLASHPRLAGAGRHRFGANHVVCALALCALVLRARPCGGFACFASCRSPLPGHAGPPALTHLACPRALAWALFVFAWGRALLGLVVGVFACGWLGFVFTRGACSLVVFACFGVCARLGVVGQSLSRRSCPACLVGAHALVWACWRVREPVGGQVRGGNGAGQSCPAPCAAWWRCRRCVRVEERRLRVGVPARSGEHNPTPSLVLAYMETGSHPVGAKQRGGATGRAWWPGWGGAFLVRAP